MQYGFKNVLSLLLAFVMLVAVFVPSVQAEDVSLNLRGINVDISQLQKTHPYGRKKFITYELELQISY